jgi:hypothetical protein
MVRLVKDWLALPVLSSEVVTTLEALKASSQWRKEGRRQQW